MWFSRSDARCFKSSAWFSRGHNFPYMCLPHFQDACIQVHIRKPSKTYIRNRYFHILSQCVTCFHIVHMFSKCSFLYNPIPMYFKVFSCSHDLPDSQFWFRRFGLDYRIFQYFWRTLIKQQFLVIEVSNNDSERMWFSRSDARCLANPVLDFLEATIFHTCAFHIF